MLTPFPAAAAALSTFAASHPQLLPSFVNMCSQVAPPMSVLVCLAPLPTIQQIKSSSTRDVGNLPLLPYTCMAANGGLWTTYGLLKQQASIWAPNLVGVLLAVYYVSEFIKLTPTSTKTAAQQHVHTLMAVAGTTVAAVMANVQADVFGQAAVLLCIALFASPLSTLKTVLQTKSARSIPLPFTVASLVACLAWSITGVWQLHDLNVIIPNALGLAFGLAQVSLKLAFRDNDNNEEAERAATLPATKGFAVASTTATESDKEPGYILATP